MLVRIAALQSSGAAAIILPAMPPILALAASRPVGDPFAAVGWVERLLTGPVGTGAAVVAVAWFGFSLLAGRLSLRRGGLVVIGCFVLFGAPSIARSLLSLMHASAGGSAPTGPATLAVPQPAMPPSPPAYDPYAGAAVPNEQ